MSQNWIKWVKGLTRRAEVLQISALLGIAPAHAAGLCMVVWEWADDNTTNGRVTNVTPSYVDVVAGHPGFGEVLEKVSWLREDGRGGITFPRWDRHNSASAKKRALSAERMARKRNRDSQNGHLEERNGARNNRVTRREYQSVRDKNWSVVLKNMTVPEFKQPPALLARYQQAVKWGLVDGSEVRAHEFFGFAAHALAEAKEPAALFVWLVRKWDTAIITNGDADTASRMLKEARK